MSTLKDDKYFLNKILTDLHFIAKHIKGVGKKELSENEILLDSMMFRLIQIQENAKRLSDDYKKRTTRFPGRT